MLVECDITNEYSVKNAVDEVIKHYDHIDILLNNAGVAVRGVVEDLSVEDWNKSFDTNVKGMYLMCKYVVPKMKKQNY